MHPPSVMLDKLSSDKSSANISPLVIKVMISVALCPGAEKNFAIITIITVYVSTAAANAIMEFISFLNWSVPTSLPRFEIHDGASAPLNAIRIKDKGNKNAKNVIATIISAK